MVYEGEKFFGISQQIFAPQREQLLFSELGANMVGNDHLAFIKTEGEWREDDFDTDVDDLNDDDDNVSFTSLDYATLISRVQSLLAWLNVSNFKTLFNQAFNPAQLPYLRQLKYTRESELLEQKLRTDMSNFVDGMKDEEYHNFEKSAYMCIHINWDGIDPTENDGEMGWWIPLKQNFVAWRAINLQKPKAKSMAIVGVVSMNKKQDELELVFKGSQFYHGDYDGIDVKNFGLDMGPPNNTYLADARPPAPEKPTSIAARNLRDTINNVLVTDQRLPWAPFEKLCPDLDADFDAMKTNCDFNQLEASKAELLKCSSAFAKFYPCFSHFLRSSRKYSHGIDGLLELNTVYHMMSEMPWKTVKTLAADEPWDEEFDEAMAMFGHA